MSNPGNNNSNDRFGSNQGASNYNNNNNYRYNNNNRFGNNQGASNYNNNNNYRYNNNPNNQDGYKRKFHHHHHGSNNYNNNNKRTANEQFFFNPNAYFHPSMLEDPWAALESGMAKK